MQKILIVVDMQNDFINGTLGSKEARLIVSKVKNKIEEYEKNGFPIVFTRDTHFDNYLETQEGKKLPVKHCIFKTNGWEITKELNSKNHTVINKFSFGYDSWKYYLKEFISDYNTSEIELVGLCTDICVISNVIILKALYPEIPITVDASCCAGTTVENHNKALDVMEICQINIINRDERKNIIEPIESRQSIRSKRAHVYLLEDGYNPKLDEILEIIFRPFINKNIDTDKNIENQSIYVSSKNWRKRL